MMGQEIEISDRERGGGAEHVAAVLRLSVLLCLFAWAFWPEVRRIFVRPARSSDMAHAMVVGFTVCALLWRRWKYFSAEATRGSAWGMVLIMGGLAIYALSTWPFSYGYVRDIAIMPVLAGVILVTCGWRVLKLSVGILLILLLAIPIGNRLYVTLIIHPETYTISAAKGILDQLPGVSITQEGVDLFFYSDAGRGVVALGESNRGAKLLLVFASIGVFVAFCRKRSPGRLVVIAAAGGPVVLFANLVQLVFWGLIAIYARPAPTSSVARNVSAVGSLLVAYGLFAIVSSFKVNLFTEVEQEQICLAEDVTDA
ncbi:MAG: exosortase/archaeosortase family protein [Planctomycetes bacterium]|nr:exosortase/archaeosortase family protein [Planctomycetota bacterium]